MAKKKLKLKSVKKIKESIKTEKSKKKKRKKKQKKNIGTILLMGIITVGIVVASIVIAFSLYIVFTAPEFSSQTLYNKESSVIKWKDGSIMTRLGTENRVIKNYEDYPQVLVDALVATEDARFFQHSGFDAARFLKASIGQVMGNSGAGGASTLSMQLAKNYFNGTEDQGIDGIIREFKDIYMSVFKIEKNYTKEQIIEMYLNSWWFAGGGTNFEGIYGVEQASQYYFGKSVSDLTLPECALLVGMVNNPTLYNPYIYPDYANDRKNIVLSLMNRHGYITTEEMQDAQSIPVESLVISKTASSTTFSYQSLVDYVVAEIEDKEGINLYKGGYEVTTTFDKTIQDVINNMQNGAAYEFRDDKVQVGTAITSVENGSIAGLGAGRNYVAKGTNRAAEDFKRQPGSTIKPLIDYGPAIEYNNASSGQMYIDFKYSYNSGSIINNWDNKHLGVMTMKDALSSSRNVTALQAYHQVDPKQIKEFLNNVGIDEANYGNGGLFESFSIGGFPNGLSPLESSAAYATFARGGYYIEPYSYLTIYNTETEETIEYKYEKTRAMSEETAWMITDILLQATAENVGGPINYNLRGTIASKSGTSNIDSASANQLGVSVYATPDHWVNTYNTEYAISMWMGYDVLDKDHYFTTPSGSTPRGKISAYLANNILTANKKFERPSTVSIVVVEKNTLPTKRASEYTPDDMKYKAYFKSGTEPSETSTRFMKLDNPTNGEAKTDEMEITLSWSPISKPEAFNTSKIRTDFANHFKTYKKNYSHSYASFETEFMKIYETYNETALGSVGYQVYLKDKNGNLTDLGWTDKTTYTYKATSSGDYEFVIKSAYSVFKTNQSSGISIKTTVKGSNASNLVASLTNTCIEKDSKFDAKKNIKVTLDGKDITKDVTVISSEVDTSKTGSVKVTITVKYENQEVKIQDTLKIAESCSN